MGPDYEQVIALGGGLSPNNARLIAAAPDLLASLHSAENCILNLLVNTKRTLMGKKIDTDSTLAVIRTAIAKSEGTI